MLVGSWEVQEDKRTSINPKPTIGSLCPSSSIINPFCWQRVTKVKRHIVFNSRVWDNIPTTVV